MQISRPTLVDKQLMVISRLLTSKGHDATNLGVQ